MPISTIPGAGLDTGSSGVAPSNLSTGGPSWDGSGNVTVSGRLQTTGQPAFFAYASNDISIASGTQTLTFNTTSINRGAAYSTSTGRFTAPVTGIYLFNVNIALASTATQILYLSAEVHVNGSRTYVGGWANKMTTTSAYTKTNISVLVPLNANDYVQPATEINASATVSSGIGYSFFNGYLVA